MLYYALRIIYFFYYMVVLFVMPFFNATYYILRNILYSMLHIIFDITCNCLRCILYLDVKVLHYIYLNPLPF
jgi:hypothetical protein